MTIAETTVFEALESNVRGYCRSWPTVFDTARGSWLTDEHGKDYLDFFAARARSTTGTTIRCSSGR